MTTLHTGAAFDEFTLVQSVASHFLFNIPPWAPTANIKGLWLIQPRGGLGPLLEPAYCQTKRPRILEGDQRDASSMILTGHPRTGDMVAQLAA